MGRQFVFRFASNQSLRPDPELRAAVAILKSGLTLPNFAAISRFESYQEALLQIIFELNPPDFVLFCLRGHSNNTWNSEGWYVGRQSVR
jgi:hypothetical protein